MKIEEFTDFSLETPGCVPGAPVYRAHFKLEMDISQLFPYINAVAKNPMYYDKPHYIQFALDGVEWAAYPNEVIGRLFEDREQALSAFSQLRDFLNDIYSKKDSLEPNFKKHKSVSVFDIFKLLPRTNCRECGYITCMAFAGALNKKEAILNQCPELNNPENKNVDTLQAMFL
jgi:ArsR family metal-binding transcriptional regulator